MTDDRGAYALNDLQVGVYKVTISRASFKTTVKEDVRIEANKTYRFDAQLEVGGVEETVVITAGSGSDSTDRSRRRERHAVGAGRSITSRCSAVSVETTRA